MCSGGKIRKCYIFCGLDCKLIPCMRNSLHIFIVIAINIFGVLLVIISIPSFSIKISFQCNIISAFNRCVAFYMVRHWRISRARASRVLFFVPSIILGWIFNHACVLFVLRALHKYDTHTPRHRRLWLKREPKIRWNDSFLHYPYNHHMMWKQYIEREKKKTRVIIV